MKLSVIVPMYNEKNIYNNLGEILNNLDKLKQSYEVIVVDDGSSNDCLKEAKRVKSKKVRVVGYKPNKGKGYAIKYGFKFAKGDYILFLDSDLDIPPRQIMDFISRIGDYDVLIGSKRHPESKLIYPKIRRFLSGGYQLFVRILFGLNVQDTQVGLKLFRRKVLKKVYPLVKIERYASDLEMLVLAHKFGYTLKEGPVTINFRLGSHVRMSAIIWMFIDTWTIFFRLNILRNYGGQK